MLIRCCGSVCFAKRSLCQLTSLQTAAPPALPAENNGSVCRHSAVREGKVHFWAVPSVRECGMSEGGRKEKGRSCHISADRAVRWEAAD